MGKVRLTGGCSGSWQLGSWAGPYLEMGLTVLEAVTDDPSATAGLVVWWAIGSVDLTYLPLKCQSWDHLSFPGEMPSFGPFVNHPDPIPFKLLT